MKKLIVFLLVFLLFSSTTCLAISTIDYDFTVNSPIYRNEEKVWGDDVVGSFSLGKSFQRQFGKLHIGGSISGYPLTEELTRNPIDYLSLSGSIDWFEAGYLRGSLRKESLGLSYSDNFFNDNFSFSLRNRWIFNEEMTTQRISLGYRKEFEDKGSTFSINTSWNGEDLEKLTNASVILSYSGSFHYSNGETISTSIIPEVYLEDNRPVKGVTINLLVDGEVVKRVKTSQGGTASFGELDPGSYIVQLVVSSLPEDLELISDREIEIELIKNSIKKAKFEVSKPDIEEVTTFSGGLSDE